MYKKARDHNRSLVGENETLKRTIRKKNKEIEKLKNKSLSRNEAYKIFKDVLSPTFTEAQISCLWKKDWERCREWTHDDYSLAITIRCISAKMYKFLRKSKMVPLPGMYIQWCGLTHRVAHTFLDMNVLLCTSDESEPSLDPS